MILGIFRGHYCVVDQAQCRWACIVAALQNKTSSDPIQFIVLPFAFMNASHGHAICPRLRLD